MAARENEPWPPFVCLGRKRPWWNKLFLPSKISLPAEIVHFVSPCAYMSGFAIDLVMIGDPHHAL
jgi:hypothetical protein